MKKSLSNYELQKMEKYQQDLYALDIDDETFTFWASVLTNHVINWGDPKTEKQKKAVKEIMEATKFIIAYNTTLKMRSAYLLSEIHEYRKNYNKECLERKALEKTVKTLQNEIQSFESE